MNNTLRIKTLAMCLASGVAVQAAGLLDKLDASHCEELLSSNSVSVGGQEFTMAPTEVPITVGEWDYDQMLASRPLAILANRNPVGGHQPPHLHTVSQVIDYTLRFGEPIPSDLPPDEKRELDEASNLLLARHSLVMRIIYHVAGRTPPRRWSATYLSFAQFRRIFTIRDDELRAIRRSKIQPFDNRTLLSAIIWREIAFERWCDEGGKAQVEAALHNYERLTLKMPEAKWGNLVQAFTDSTNARTDPVNATRFRQVRPPEAGPASKVRKQCLISVERPWLLDEEFLSTQWRWKQSAPGGTLLKVSDGSSPNEGIMPLLPCGFVAQRKNNGDGATQIIVHAIVYLKLPLMPQ